MVERGQAPLTTSCWDRRAVLRAAGVATAGAAFLSIERASAAAGTTRVRIQYDWLLGNGQLGDIVAQRKGFFQEEGLDVSFGPGGPNAQTVPPVLAGQALIAQFSSVAQFLTAFEAGRPLKLFACGFRYSPYAYISLPTNPVRTPRDFVGKTIGINPNGRYMLDLMMAKYGLDRSSVKVVTMGADMAPLITGQVDAVTGFVTNTKALSVLGPDIVTIIPGKEEVPNYANAYFTASDVYDEKKETLAKFVRAVGRGWGWAYENRRGAVDLMCDAYPALDRKVEYSTVDLIMALTFDATTKAKGWGWFDRSRIQTQIALFKDIGKFQRGLPDVDACASWGVLDMTADARPKIG